jgi:hypothetical protein
MFPHTIAAMRQELEKMARQKNAETENAEGFEPETDGADESGTENMTAQEKAILVATRRLYQVETKLKALGKIRNYEVSGQKRKLPDGTEVTENAEFSEKTIQRILGNLDNWVAEVRHSLTAPRVKSETAKKDLPDYGLE